jgi:ectoine hydroxylase-related dioxygenase (phytanoyl-CoA dioxygenase family)
MSMVAKSPLAAEEVINHPLYQDVCNVMLSKTNWYWSGLEKIEAVSTPQLSNSVCFSIRPGARDQQLHRDSWCHQTYETEIEVYPDDYEREVGIGLFIAGKPATRQNGATRCKDLPNHNGSYMLIYLGTVIPGSHLWSKDRPPQEELCVYAEMEPGDAFMMLASCYHGGSANKSKDQERLLFR